MSNWNTVRLICAQHVGSSLASVGVSMERRTFNQANRGLARVIPQALLVGRPVISYDIDGASEVVLPETGILLKPRDLDGLRQAILTLAANPTTRAAMGHEGRTRFADQFRQETMTRRLRSLYERILELQSHPACVRA